MAEPQSDEKSADDTGPHLLPPGPVFQVSMRSILLTMGGAALMIAAVFSFPPLLSAILAALMAIGLPPALVACVVYGNRSWRAFAVGTLTPTALRLFGHAPLGSSIAIIGAMAGWQSYPPLQSGDVPIDSAAYFAQLAEGWSQVGHALMAEEALFWITSFGAGLIALAIQRHFDEATKTT